MKWDDVARQLVEASKGKGKCIYTAIHQPEDGQCLGRYPKDAPQIKVQEVMMLKKAFREPTMLFSSGIVLRDVKFTFVKLEGNALFGRTSDTACFILQMENAYIVCIYPGDELSKKVYEHCISICERLKNC